MVDSKQNIFCSNSEIATLLLFQTINIATQLRVILCETNTRRYAFAFSEREKHSSSPCQVILFLAGIAGPAIANMHSMHMHEKMVIYCVIDRKVAILSTQGMYIHTCYSIKQLCMAYPALPQ